MAEKVSESKVAFSRKKIGGESPIVISEIMDKCLYSGFFGTLDSSRVSAITERILDIMSKTDNEIIIFDLSNVDFLDSAVAVHLAKLGNTLRMIGVKTIFCGITPVIAQTMVTFGVEFGKFRISKNLKSALKEAFLIQGLMLVPFSSSIEQQQQQQQQQQ